MTTDTRMTVPGETHVDIRQGFMPNVLSQRQAAFQLKQMWPKAPDAQVIRAALICQQYQLNPLLKNVYLVVYNEGKPSEAWEVLLGIKATRQMAKKNHKGYAYAEGPRAMTEAEQVAILGEVDKNRFWAITIVEENGRRYPGYGSWNRGAGVFGSDKGNSPQNMAFIRSERSALDKMAPGELPDVGVADDQYTPITNLKVAVEEGKREFQAQVEVDVDTLYGGEKAPDQPTTPPPAPKPPVAQATVVGQGKDEPAVVGTRDWMIQSLPIIRWTEKTLVSWVNSQIIKPAGQPSLAVTTKPAQVWEVLSEDERKVLCDHIKAMAEAS